jgi:hypothetical protein
MMINGKKPKVEILWGVEKKGIQSKDRIGLCKIFTRFWTYITLQLLKICKDNNNTCFFNEELLREGENLLQEKLKTQFPDEEDKDYDVIITWMYRMIIKFFDGNVNNNLNVVNKRLLNKLDNADPKAKNTEYDTIDTEWPAGRFYTEFNDQLDIPIPKSIQKGENYRKTLINSVNDLPLQKQLENLEKLIKRTDNLIRIQTESKKEQELMLNDEKAKNRLVHQAELIENINEHIDKLIILNKQKKIYDEQKKIVENQLKNQEEEKKQLDSEWKELGLDKHNNENKKILGRKRTRKNDNSSDKKPRLEDGILNGIFLFD